MNIFGLPWPWDLRGPGTYSKLVQSPLLIDLMIDECQILMIFSFFSWKCRRSSAWDLALRTNTRYFGGRSLHVCLKKFKHTWDVIYFMPKYRFILAIMNMTPAKSDVNGSKKKVSILLTYFNKKKLQNHQNKF